MDKEKIDLLHDKLVFLKKVENTEKYLSALADRIEKIEFVRYDKGFELNFIIDDPEIIGWVIMSSIEIMKDREFQLIRLLDYE